VLSKFLENSDSVTCSESITSFQVMLVQAIGGGSAISAHEVGAERDLLALGRKLKETI
jgi:hypothetical protein